MNWYGGRELLYNVPLLILQLRMCSFTVSEVELEFAGVVPKPKIVVPIICFSRANGIQCVTTFGLIT